MYFLSGNREVGVKGSMLTVISDVWNNFEDSTDYVLFFIEFMILIKIVNIWRFVNCLFKNYPTLYKVQNIGQFYQVRLKKH